MLKFILKQFARLPYFAKVGALAGAGIGAMIELLERYVHSIKDLIIMGIAVTSIAFIVTLIFFGIWIKYTIKQIALQTFIASYITGAAVVYILHVANILKSYYAIIGYLIGIIIGIILYLLCTLPCWFRKSSKITGKYKAY